MGGVGIVGVDFSALFDPRRGNGKIKNLSLGFQRLNSIYNLISYFDCRANTKQQDQHLLLETCGCGTQTTRRRGLMSGCGKVIYMDICASSLGGTVMFAAYAQHKGSLSVIFADWIHIQWRPMGRPLCIDSILLFHDNYWIERPFGWKQITFLELVHPELWSGTQRFLFFLVCFQLWRTKTFRVSFASPLGSLSHFMSHLLLALKENRPCVELVKSSPKAHTRIWNDTLFWN